ncbi:unnamed protein product [Heterobilharzia americana]|nr:unnamed protein product [Heterobilharzia americana]
MSAYVVEFSLASPHRTGIVPFFCVLFLTWVGAVAVVASLLDVSNSLVSACVTTTDSRGLGGCRLSSCLVGLGLLSHIRIEPPMRSFALYHACRTSVREAYESNWTASSLGLGMVFRCAGLGSLLTLLAGILLRPTLVESHCHCWTS